MSRQLDQYLRLRFRHGVPRDEAADEAGVLRGEAVLHDKSVEAGEQIIPDPQVPWPQSLEATAGGVSSTAPVARKGQHSADPGGHPRTDEAGEHRHNPEETNMARTARKAPQVEEIGKPDFDLAVSIYRKDIKPAASKVGEHSQEMSTAYKDIKKRANIQPQAAKLAFKLDDMEESKRDDFLRSLNGLLKRLNIFMPTDLVDAAEGKGGAGDNVVPTGSRERPKLVTVEHPADDSDLAEAAE